MIFSGSVLTMAGGDLSRLKCRPDAIKAAWLERVMHSWCEPARSCDEGVAATIPSPRAPTFRGKVHDPLQANSRRTNRGDRPNFVSFLLKTFARY